MIVALIPVKSLDTGKSRLRASLPGEAIPALSLAMLEDVVDALKGVPELDSITVVTPDKNVGEAATQMGAQALVRQDPGLDASIAMAAKELSQEQLRDRPDESLDLLVIMGDLPGASSEAIQLFLDQSREFGERGVLIAPSADGGTTLLLRKPWDAMETAYGPNSSSAHYELAKRAGLPVALFRHPELAVDLDEPEDLLGFLQNEGAGHKTRALLQRLLPQEQESSRPLSKAEAS
jgi:2-phospho-L-lactate guanylyltransferase